MSQWMRNTGMKESLLYAMYPKAIPASTEKIASSGGLPTWKRANGIVCRIIENSPNRSFNPKRRNPRKKNSSAK